MKRIALTAQTRGEVGKGANRRLRTLGKIPAILYGQKNDPMMLAVDSHELTVSTARVGDEMVMFNLSVPESSLIDQLIMIRDIQRDPVTERVTHLDLLRIDATKPIDFEVPVHSAGVPAGVAIQGGVLEHGMRTVHLRCLVEDIPDHVTVDITGLGINQSFHVRDLQLGDRIEVLSNAKDVLFLVAVPRKEEVAVVAAPGAAAAEGAEAKPGEEKKEEPAKK